MNSLIKELKNEHKEILDIIYEIKIHGISSKQGLDKLLLARRIFLDHLVKENQHVYYYLLNVAKFDSKLRALLKNMIYDLYDITIYVYDFFNKYTIEENRFNGQFALDASKLLIKLKTRIINEERFLFDAYNQHFIEYQSTKINHPIH